MGEPTPNVVVIGCGGHARVVAEALGAGRIAGHLAPEGAEKASAELGPWLGDDSVTASLAASGHRFAIGLGFVDRAGASRRAEILKGLTKALLLSVVHPTAIVSPSALIGAGSFVAAGAIVSSRVTLGTGAIVNTGAIVDHDCRIGNNVHLASGAILSGDVRVGEHSLIGTGASIRQRIHIATGVTVGAGAVVISDLAQETIAVGVPARAITTTR